MTERDSSYYAKLYTTNTMLVCMHTAGKIIRFVIDIILCRGSVHVTYTSLYFVYYYFEKQFSIFLLLLMYHRKISHSIWETKIEYLIKILKTTEKKLHFIVHEQKKT